MSGHDSEVKHNNEVLLGGAPCEVVFVNSKKILVKVLGAPSGTHLLSVRVAGKGLARSKNPIEYTVAPKITRITPTQGGLGGMVIGDG